jgi:hypothetical protein
VHVQVIDARFAENGDERESRLKLILMEEVEENLNEV